MDSVADTMALDAGESDTEVGVGLLVDLRHTRVLVVGARVVSNM